MVIFVLTVAFFTSRDNQAQGMLIPVPAGKQGFIYSPVTVPQPDHLPSSAKPVGIGSLAAGGDTLSIQVSLGQFEGTVDIFGAYRVSDEGSSINVISPGDNSFSTFTLSEIINALATGVLPEGISPWKENTEGPVQEHLFDLPATVIAPGTYSIYLLVTPAGSLGSYYLWETSFQIPQMDTVSISGDLTYDHVPATQTSGLHYQGTIQKPIRGAVVEAVRVSDSSVLYSTTSDSSGNYAVAVPVNTDIVIRIKSQLLKGGTPSWDFRVVDNTRSKSLYAAESLPFSSGSNKSTNKSLHAPSGWGGSLYTSPRSAAPFAILDVAYQALNKILAADADVSLPPLVINWSVDNIAVYGDKAMGQIGTSHYDTGEKELYILGKEDNDTDEYDDHVVAHELGHYLEHRLSRSDSMGGNHSIGDRLDPRIAFSEGLSNALSGMITDDPHYIDTSGTSQANTGLFIDLEDKNLAESAEGWFSELSTTVILYDLYDSNDPVSLGFDPLYDVMVNRQKLADSFSTIFSFMAFLKERYPSASGDIAALLEDENISGSFSDQWDSTQTETNNGGYPKSLPVYSVLSPGGAPAEVCGSSFFGNYNKFMNRRFFYFRVSSSGNYRVTAMPDMDGDPVIVLYSKGKAVALRDNGGNGVAETVSVFLSPGDYAGEIYDWGHVFGSRINEECFAITLN